MKASVPTKRFTLWFTAALAVVLAIAFAQLGASGVSAADNSLTWKLSQHSWASSSLAPSHQAGVPAHKEPANGWVFPLASNATYNPATGAMQLNFAGSLTLGNVNQGGYRIMLANPTITVDAADNGTVKADVSYCASTADCLNPWIGPVNATITTFNLPDASVTASGLERSFTVTPFWATVGNRFHQEFLDALPASLRAHFRATGSSSDVNKPPAPLTVEFDYLNSVGGDVTLAVGGATTSGVSTNLLAVGALAIVAVGAGVAVTRKRFR
jgi:hypothetical protein